MIGSCQNVWICVAERYLNSQEVCRFSLAVLLRKLERERDARGELGIARNRGWLREVRYKVERHHLAHSKIGFFKIVLDSDEIFP